MNIAERIAQFVVRTKFQNMPLKTIEYSKILALKCLAAMVAGTGTSSSKRIVKHIKERPCISEARVIGYNFKTSVEYAVLASGFFAHASELEDDQFPGPTSSITIFPVVFPLSEKINLSGKEAIEASIIGFEVMNRIARFTEPRMDEMGICPLSFFGVLGAASVTAKALGLNVKQTKASLGLSLTQSSGYYWQSGTDAHYLDSAFACRNGVTSAFLARDGVTSNAEVEKWLVALLGRGGVKLDCITSRLGKPPFFIHNIWVKKFPGCFAIQRHIDALLALMERHKFQYADVESIEVHVGSRDALSSNRPEPKDPEESKFSFQHVLACVLLERDVGLSSFSVEKINDPQFKEARSKVRISIHPEWGHEVLAGIGRVTVVLKNGRMFSKSMEQSVGGPKLPLTKEQVIGLYRKYTRSVLSDEQISQTADLVLNLESVEDASELLDNLDFTVQESLNADCA
jgi:2-methylcitrate dehydratase PrpD